jgi:hypothetical protein
MRVPYHQTQCLRKAPYRPAPLDLEPDLAGELERLVCLLPERLIPRPVELGLVAEVTR